MLLLIVINVQIFVGEKYTMHKNHVTWSRVPSSENVSEVFIYSDYDKINEDERALMPKMLAIYSETMESIDKYERMKTKLFVLGLITLMASWFYLAIVSNT